MAAPPAYGNLSLPSPTVPSRSVSGSSYQSPSLSPDGPYQNGPTRSVGGTQLDAINPDDIADDGDDGFLHTPVVRNGNGKNGVRSSAVALMKGQKPNNTVELTYDPVPGGKDYFPEATKSNRKRGWHCLFILAFIVIGAIVGGIVGGIVGNGNVGNKEGHSNTKHNSRSLISHSAGCDEDLGRESPEIQGLLNNGRLHKVFPAMDYTPPRMQYPTCSGSQNDITRDLSVLSQLTHSVRLYSTDCNQSEMVLHAIRRLGLTDMKIWLGVSLDTNTASNNRQLQQLYKVLDSVKDKSVFKGVIVGSEALFRGGSDTATTEKDLIEYMRGIKAAFTRKNIKLPVATSSRADKWSQDLAQVSDFFIPDINPFYAGVPVDLAADWTLDFWQRHNTPLTKGTSKKQIISEIGWPSDGGDACGFGNKCPTYTAGSVAGIDAMNRFMNEWVCQAIESGTEYIWYV